MPASTELITHFYTSFQNKDYVAMQECYDDNATFSDAVFENLDAYQVRAMWEMLCKRGKDLNIQFRDIKATDESGTVEWIANYTFTSTGNHVENRIKATFIFKDGKIVSHNDDFDFYHWARQALGLKGLLLGWMPFVHNKVKATARKSLNDFMSNKN